MTTTPSAHSSLRFFAFLGLLFIQMTVFAQPQVPEHTFVLTDAQPSAIVVDSTRSQLFVSIPRLNRVNVYSLQTLELIDRIDIASPAGMDLTLDGARLIVGSGGSANFYLDSGTQFLSIVDPATHKLIGRYLVPELPNEISPEARLPDRVTALANDVVAIRMGSYGTDASKLVTFDLKTGVFSVVNTGSLKPLAVYRLGTSSRVFTMDSSTSGAIEIIDAITTQVAAAAKSGYLISDAAISPDGNRIAVQRDWNRLELFDGQLTDLGTIIQTPNTIQGFIFSADNTQLYVMERGTGGGAFIEVVDVATQSKIGTIPGGFSEHGSAIPVALGPDGKIFAYTERGFFALDNTIRQVSGNAPGGYSAAVKPSVGSIAGGTSATLTSIWLTTPLAVYLGGHPVPQATLIDQATLNFITPPGSAPGPKDLVVDMANGWRSYVPHAFSYGPHILYSDTTAGPVQGGTIIDLIGDGFGGDASKIQVTVGTQAATVNSVTPSLAITPFMLPMQHLYITTPGGSPGLADIVLHTPDGTSSLLKGFRYYSIASNPGITPAGSNISFDRWRNRVLVSSAANNTIDVVDANTLATLQQISVTNPLGMAFSPDGSKLVVASGTTDELVVFDAVTFAATHIPLSFAFAYGRPEKVFPETVAVTSTGKALVGVPDYDLLGGGYMVVVDLSTGEQKSNNPWDTYPSYLDMRSIEGGNRILISPVSDFGHTIWIWDAASESITETHGCPAHTDFAFTDDLQLFACGRGVLDSEFRWTARAQTHDLTSANPPPLVYGLSMHPGGSLLVEPHQDSLWLFDTNTGQEVQRINLPGNIPVALSAVALSPNGSTAYVITDKGLMAVALDPLPLMVGTVVPSEVSVAAENANVTVRGSGFREGISLFVDDEPATVNSGDSNSLSVTLPSLAEGQHSITVKNIDGGTYTKPVALNVYGTVPIIKGTTPATFGAGVGDVSATLFGLNFHDDSVVTINGVPVQTSGGSLTTLNAVIPGTMLQTEGSVSITVVNHGGAVSQPLVVPVKYPPGKWSVGTTDLQLGTHHVGEQYSYDFGVGNGGDGPLFNVSIGLESPAVTQTNNCPATMLPLTSCTIHMVLDSSAPIVADGVVHLVATDHSRDVPFKLTVIPAGPYLIVRDYGPSLDSGYLGDSLYHTMVISALDAAVTISSLKASDPDATITSNCSSVTPAGCDIQIHLVPTIAGNRTVSGTIESDASNSPTVLTTAFDVKFPLSFEETGLNWSKVMLGNSASLSVKIVNSAHQYTGRIQSVSATAPFTVVSRCGSTIAPNSSCWIDVTINAQSLGTKTGTVTVTTTDGTLSLNLIANVVDFAVGLAPGQPSTMNLKAGESGTLDFVAAGVSGFQGNIQIGCSSAIPAATCVMTPSQISIDSTGAQVGSVLKITTTKRVLSSKVLPVPSGGKKYLTWLSGVTFGIVFLGARRTRNARTCVAVCLLTLLFSVSCGGGGGNGYTPPPPETGTPAGTYTVTVKASLSLTDPSPTHTTIITVKVD